MSTASEASSTAWGDAELVRRAQRGEPGAFDALFERHYPKVYNFALKMEGNRDNAEDIAQTAFVRAYQALPRIRDGQALLAFLYRVVVNLVRDRARSASRKPWVRFLDLFRSVSEQDSGAEPVEFADDSLDPEHAAISEARQRALTAAIADLPLPFREALVLHHIEQMDIAEIATLLGVAEGTVKSRLARARQRLRTALSDWMADAEPSGAEL